MDKNLVIQRLENTIEKLKQLPPENFNYSLWITDSKEDCGTVCCVGGWYPKWFPQSGLIWVDILGGVEIDHVDGMLIVDALSAWHGISIPETKALFAGQMLFDKQNDIEILDPISIHAPLIVVIDRWEQFLKHKKDEL
jgi:hypothetical protein